MPVILKHPDAQIRIDDISNDKRRIKVNISNKSIFAPIKSCETKYPVHLIRQILNVKGPAYLCDEILREDYLKVLGENCSPEVKNRVGNLIYLARPHYTLRLKPKASKATHGGATKEEMETVFGFWKN